MFYSHEILTSPQHGVATIWLVATLGSKSNLKKVTRRAILDVDVPKACSKITDPTAPMALRLQGSLLYGVTRVFSQQCAYALADSQSFRDKMRGVVAVMKDLDLEHGVGRARTEQLNFADDPAFIPELDMNLDLSIFDIPSDISRSSRSQSPNSLISSQTSLPPDNIQELGVRLPSVDESDNFGDFDDNLGAPASVSSRSLGRVSILDTSEQPILDLSPGFNVGADDEIMVLDDEHKAQPTLQNGQDQAFEGLGCEASAVPEVQEERMTPKNANMFAPDDEGVLMDDDSRLPEAEPFPPTKVQVGDNGGQVLSKSPSERFTHDSTTSVTVEAPQQQQQRFKQVPVDLRAELSNKQLGDWSTNYLRNMNRASRLKLQHKSLAQAKRNAAFWVLEQGIGGVRVNFGDEREAHPLAIFSGQSFFDLFVRFDTSSLSSKRSRSSSGDVDDPELEGDERRVRARNEEQDEAGGLKIDTPGPLDIGDDAIVLDDNYHIESERGREAPPSLQDQSIIPPWSAMATSSRQGSLQPHGPISSSAGGHTGAGHYGLSSSMRKRGSRLTSASPLHGRGLMRAESIEPYPLPSERGSMYGSEHELPTAGATISDQYELYGPAAIVDSQTAAQSQWVAAALENEARNFLTFLKTQVLDHAQQEGLDKLQQLQGSITMHQLLPPAEHSKVVAAQALLHILSLTTEGYINVRQEEDFGDIHMSITTGHAAEVMGGE